VIPIAVLALITEALKLVNNLIEGIPVEQRQAQAKVWFLATWPMVKGIMKLVDVSDADLKQIEDLARGANANSNSKP